MKRFLLLLSWKHRDGSVSVTFEMFDDLETAKAAKQSAFNESGMSSCKLESSVILKVKEVG